MKIKVSKQTMINGLQKVQSIVPTNSTLSILSNVMLHASDNKLTISATDLDINVRVTVDAEIEQDGSTTTDAKRLFSIFRELDGSEADMQVGDNNLTTIESDSSLFKLNGMSSEDFPQIPEVESDTSYTIESGVFKEMLQKTFYAASTDETRMALNGVLLSFKDEKLTVVATDGRRLALVEQEVEFPASAEADLILPPKTVSELIRTLDGDDVLKIKLGEGQISFEFANMLVVSKLVDDTYPNYSQVIPDSSEVRVQIERELLLGAVRRAALLTTDQSNSVRLCFSENNLEIVTETPEVGEAKETIAVKYAGPVMSIAFNPHFLMAPLKSLQSDDVYFEMTDEMSPGVIKADVPFLYVIMPMRIS